MTARSISRRAWRLLGSTGVLVFGVLLLAVSALSGNIFQNTSRGDLKNDLTTSRHETQLARGEIAALQTQLDMVKGEQECRSQIASESELITGRLLAGIGKLLTAANDRDAVEGQTAIAEIAEATVALVPALTARQDSVETCAGAKAPPVVRAPQTSPAPTSSTTTTTKPRTVRRTTTTTRPTSTTGPTTTTTIHRSSPRPAPAPAPCQPIPLLTIPGVPTCI